MKIFDEIIGRYEGCLVWKCRFGFYHADLIFGTHGGMYCTHGGNTNYSGLEPDKLPEITDEKIIKEIKSVCTNCHGKGRWEEYEIGILTCTKCNGTGKLTK